MESLVTLSLDFVAGNKNIQIPSTGHDLVVKHPPISPGHLKITPQKQVIRLTKDTNESRRSRSPYRQSNAVRQGQDLHYKPSFSPTS